MNIALILSGGTGVRIGSETPKQYIEVEGTPVIAYSIECLSAHERIDAIQIVADASWQAQIKEWLTTADMKQKFRGFSEPGETRQLSIIHGLGDIREYAADSDYVLIHDAARPMLSSHQITQCLDAVGGHDGVMPILPMKNAVYISTDGKRVSQLLQRSHVFAGQAPELFRLGTYYQANCQIPPEQIYQISGSTEPAILAGMDIAMIPGDEENFKITTMVDLERFRKIAKERRK